MPLVSNIDFAQLVAELKGMTFLVWGEVPKSFFVAQNETEKDSAHVHLFGTGEDLDTLLLTFVAKGAKKHPDAKSVTGDKDEEKNWTFEFDDTQFNGSQIETALKGFGAKQADAASVQATFSAIVTALASQ